MMYSHPAFTAAAIEADGDDFYLLDRSTTIHLHLYN